MRDVQGSARLLFALCLALMAGHAAASERSAAPTEEGALRRCVRSAPSGTYSRGESTVLVAVVRDDEGLSTQEAVEAELLLRLADEMRPLSPSVERSDVPIDGIIGDRALQIHRLAIADANAISVGESRLLWREIGESTGRLVIEVDAISLVNHARQLPPPDWSLLEAQAILELEDSGSLPELSRELRARGLVFDAIRLKYRATPHESFVGLTRSTANQPQPSTDWHDKLFATPGEHAAHRELHLLAALAQEDSPARKNALRSVDRAFGSDAAGVEYGTFLSLVGGRLASPLVESADRARASAVRPVLATGGHLQIRDDSTPNITALVEDMHQSFRQGQQPQAVLDTIFRVIAADPDQAEAWALGGSILRFEEDHLAAVAFLHQSLLIEPDAPLVRWNLARSYQALGLRSLAGAIAERLIGELRLKGAPAAVPELPAKLRNFIASTRPQAS